MSTPHTPERVRLTISVTPEVHAAFQRLAAASGMSISRAMGDWLGDTIEAVEFTAGKVEEARSAPSRVMREMHSLALALATDTAQVLERVSRGGAAGAGKRSAAPAAPPSPPSSNTGGKVPRKPKPSQARGTGGAR